MERAIHQVNNTLTYILVEAKLNFLEIVKHEKCETPVDNYLFLEDNLNEVFNSIRFARLQLNRRLKISCGFFVFSI